MIKKILLCFIILVYPTLVLANERIDKISQLYQCINMDAEHINYVINLAYQYGIDPDVVLAIIWTESNFNPLAKNKRSSASGYSQMIKSTAVSCANNIDTIKDYNHSVHAMDPYINLQLMIYYIDRCLYTSGGNLDRALTMYRGVSSPSYNKTVKDRVTFIKRNKKSK